MKKIALIAAALMSLTFAACGGSDSPVDKFDDFVAENNRAVDAFCGCSTDPATCKAENSIDAATASCMRDVVDANASAVEPMIDCLAGPSADFADCIVAAGCTDQTALTTCSNAYDAATANCPEVSAEVDAMFEACFPQ